MGDRRRGSVRVRGGSLQVRVFAGVDPVTGKDRYLAETVRGTDRAARRVAEKAMARLQTEVDGQRSASSSVSLGYVLDEWLRTVELEDSTRETYVGYVERTLRPALGLVSIAKLSTRTVETFYAELRRCRTLCGGRSSVVHRVEGEHDWVKARCGPACLGAGLGGSPAVVTTSDGPAGGPRAPRPG